MPLLPIKALHVLGHLQEVRLLPFHSDFIDPTNKRE